MKYFKLIGGLWIFLVSIFFLNTKAHAQRVGALPKSSIKNQLLIADGPEGPIKGGESAVTDMILMDDGWVYGSTKATWGADHAHLFRSNGKKVEHVLNVTSELPDQTSISDLVREKDSYIIGSTSTYNKILDEESTKYEGGHLFTFNLATKQFNDLGVIASGEGINCIAIDSTHGLIYGVTYPGGHLFSYNLNTKSKKDYGEIMTPRRVENLGRISWNGVPKVLMIDDAGSVYYATYYREEKESAKAGQSSQEGSPTHSTSKGGRIYRLAYGADAPVFTGAVVPTQKGMDSDPLYENGIASAIRARNGGFWCGSINDGFLFKFYPSTSTVVNKGKAFQYWNLKSLTYGKDGKLYMLGGRKFDNAWLLSYDAGMGSINSLGFPDHTAQASVSCATQQGKILIAENRRFSRMWVFDPYN